MNNKQLLNNNNKQTNKKFILFLYYATNRDHKIFLMKIVLGIFDLLLHLNSHYAVFTKTFYLPPR